MMHPPLSIGQREDYYRHSPTLLASQTLAASYTGRPESPFQPYLPYQPYSNQQQLPSPTMGDAYRSSGSLSSPGLGPFLSHYGVHEERSEYKADPYRSAYSQSVNNNNNNTATTKASSHHSNGSPYLGSGSGSPNTHEDFSSSFESRLSGLRSQPNSSNSLRYPMRDLAGQDSNQALSASYYEHGGHGRNQQQKQQQQQQQQSSKRATPTATSSENGGVQSDQDLAAVHIRQSTNKYLSQASKTDSSGTKKAKTVEEDEEDEILQKLGVFFESVLSGGPAEMSKDGIEEAFHLQLLVDSRANYLPIRLNRLDMKIWLQAENTKIADNANIPVGFVIQPRVAEMHSVHMRLKYRTTQKDSGRDRILEDLIEACTLITPSPQSMLPKSPGSRPPGFDLIVGGKLDVWGLSWVWKPEFSLSVEDVPCPVHAPSPLQGDFSSSPGVATILPATAFVEAGIATTTTTTLDPSQPIVTTHAAAGGKTTSAASFP
ncbi:hypothetical protein BGX29_006456 [Mortierella sp. GBA35]|nr:hypothetical protein BGX29_006456 [Mortierella sp. GBA35]